MGTSNSIATSLEADMWYLWHQSDVLTPEEQQFMDKISYK